ncbi:MAG TPA: hypothetical protein GXX49_11355 [Clostridiaceae bacterium]|jgi:hypothetical protein|nr:hypothetical protein [Clostridiaceae bacterium]
MPQKKYPYPSKASASQIENFPLPNEAEVEAVDTKEPVSKPVRSSSLLSFLTHKIGMEEIILIGLIFLLLEESIKDDILLLILIYLLIAGRD